MVWLVVIGGNVFAGSQHYLRLVMRLMLLTPALVFIRATIDAASSSTALVSVEDKD